MYPATLGDEEKTGLKLDVMMIGIDRPKYLKKIARKVDSSGDTVSYFTDHNAHGHYITFFFAHDAYVPNCKT